MENIFLGIEVDFLLHLHYHRVINPKIDHRIPDNKLHCSVTATKTSDISRRRSKRRIKCNQQHSRARALQGRFQELLSVM